MRDKKSLIIMILSLVVFFSVTFIFTAKNGFTYDDAIIQWIDQVSNGAIVNVMNIISMIGSSEVILLVTVLIGAIFLLKRDWQHLLFFFTVSVGGVVVNFVLKVLFQRERPGEMSYIEVFNYSLEIPSYSFPSGHTMRSTILFLFLMYLVYHFMRSSSLKVIAYIGCVLTIIGIAFSRLFLEAHFLSDTLGAISISITWFFLCLFVLNRVVDNNKSTIYRSW